MPEQARLASGGFNAKRELESWGALQQPALLLNRTPE